VGELRVSSIDSDGNFKTAEDCFIEVMNKSSNFTPTPARQKNASSNVFDNEHSSPSILFKVLNSKFPEWKEWEPETIWDTIRNVTGSSPDESNRNKIMAAKALYASDDFFTEWHVFEKIVLAFNGIVPNFVVHEEPSPGQIAYAVGEANKIIAGIFSHEIIRYVRFIFGENGFLLFPKELSFAEPDKNDIVEYMKGYWEGISNVNQLKPESPERIQLEKITSISKYIEQMNSLALGVK
jgi:hypothetical protein